MAKVEYTVEVNSLRSVNTSYGQDWNIMGTETRFTGEEIHLASAVFSTICAEEAYYHDRIARDQRVTVSLVKWPETGWGETLDYAVYDHDGLVER